MDSYAGTLQFAFYILLQVVAHRMGFFQADVPGHHYVQVNVALVSCLTGAQFVEFNQLANMFHDSGSDDTLFSLGQFYLN